MWFQCHHHGESTKFYQRRKSNIIYQTPCTWRIVTAYIRNQRWGYDIAGNHIQGIGPVKVKGITQKLNIWIWSQCHCHGIMITTFYHRRAWEIINWVCCTWHISNVYIRFFKLRVWYILGLHANNDVHLLEHAYIHPDNDYYKQTKHHANSIQIIVVHMVFTIWNLPFPTRSIYNISCQVFI